MGSIGFIAAIILMTGIAWLVLTNPAVFDSIQNNSDDDGPDNDIPLKEIFYEYNHESTKAWLKWIDGQDESKKQFAYDMLTDYLDSPLKKLGVITNDVVKAIVVFKKKTGAFEVLAKLLKKSKTYFPQYKSIDLFYEAAAIGLTKIDHEKAEAFLVNELQDSNFNNNLVTVQRYLIRALCHLEFNPNLEKCWVRILTDQSYPQPTKKELLIHLETKADKIRERIYKKILNEQIDSNMSSLSENDKFILEEVFLKLKNLVTKEDYDEDIWDAMSRACDSTRIGKFAVKYLADMITMDEQSLSQNQILELLNKSDRTIFLEACSKRYKLLEAETNMLKVPIKAEDISFEKTKFNVEKSKKTKNVAHELLENYHKLEAALRVDLNGQADKSSNSVSVITGSGENEKLYLLRAFAANQNKAFIYVDVQQLLYSEGIAKEFKNHVANTKPCLVYLDKMHKVLDVDLEKKEASIFKSITRSIKDLSVLPSITFTANIPYTQDELLKSDLNLIAKMITGVGSMYNTIMTMNKPNDSTREKIIHGYLEKLNPNRITASENFSVDELLEHTAQMDTLEMTLFLHQYFEVSLLANGKLISLEEFNNRWLPPIVTEESEDELKDLMVPDVDTPSLAEAPEIGVKAEDATGQEQESEETHSAKL